jgi:hypothetical protein
MTQNDAQYTARVRVPSSDIEADRYAIVVWVSASEALIPLQSLGGWLDNGRSD